MKLKSAFLFGLASLALTACEDGSTTTTTSSYDRHVTVVNNTNVVMTRFYGSNAGSSIWEEDILGQDVLPPGSSVRIDFNDGSGYCNFDLKAEFRDGSTLINNNVDVCKARTVTFQ